MRVISQKDMPVIIDLPYERIGVSQSYEDPNYIIGFDTAASDDDYFYLARYSTPKKAEKAMQKLHDRYEYIWECTNEFDVYHKIDTIVFRFPQDDEL